MAVYFNGVNIPENGDYFYYNGVNLDKVYYNNVLVWEKIKETSFTMMNNWMEDVACVTIGGGDTSVLNIPEVGYLSDDSTKPSPAYTAILSTSARGVTGYALFSQDSRSTTVNLGSSFAGWTLKMVVDVDPDYNVLEINGAVAGTVASNPRTIFQGTVGSDGSITIHTNDVEWKWDSGPSISTAATYYSYYKDDEEWYASRDPSSQYINYFTSTRDSNIARYEDATDPLPYNTVSATKDIKLKVTVTLTNGTTTLKGSISGTEQAEFNGKTFTLKQ